MKKLIIAVIALVGFSAACFAQSVPAAKKSDATKLQVAKKATDAKTDAKILPINKVTKPTLTTSKPAAVTKVVAKPPATAAVTKTSAATLKKDGTPDKRFKANQEVTKGPLKKNGTPDLRFKANKKHS